MDTSHNIATPEPEEVAALPPILIADDNTDDLFFTGHLIKRTGTKHPVITFDDGTAVVDYLKRTWLGDKEKSQSPLLLFLDLKMANLGGFGFLEWVSRHPELTRLHVVVLSGSDEPEDVTRAKSLGAKRYLAKHPGVGTFARIIGHAFGAPAVAGERPALTPIKNAFFEPRVIPAPSSLRSPDARS